MKLIATITAITFSSLLFWSCKKDLVTYLQTNSTDGKANVKIVYASSYTTNYNVEIKVNDIRVSNNIANGTPFPGGGFNPGTASQPLYALLKPGNNQIALSVPKVNSSIDSIALFSTQINVEANKYYSAYIADTGANTKVVLVPENITMPTGNISRYKFVNLIPNVPALDLYWGANKMASNIAYTGVSPEFTLNRADTGRFYIRTAGAASTAPPIAIYPVPGGSVAAITVPFQRVLTIFARGYNGATGNRAPAVSMVYNN